MNKFRATYLFISLLPFANIFSQNFPIKKTVFRGSEVLVYPNDSVDMTTIGIISSLPDGKYYGFFGDDTLHLRVIINYLNGKIEGDYTEYFYSTQLISKLEFYSKGLRQGHWREYDYSVPGEILHEGEYKDNLRNGMQYSYSGGKGNSSPYNTCFYRNDTLVYNLWAADHDSTVYYNGWERKYYLTPKSKCDSSGGRLIENRKEGLWRRYYPNGKSEYVGEYHNDRKCGTWKDYYQNGKLALEYICDSESKGSWLTGVVAQYDTLGNSLDVGNFRNGKGKLFRYYPSGKLRSESLYSSADRVDSEKYYNENGTLTSELYWSKGLKQGVQKSYFDNGNPKSEINYRHDEPNGTFTSWHENGKIETQGAYKNLYGSFRYKLWYFFPKHRIYRMCGTGRQLARYMQGKWVEYDSTGKIISEEHYKYGERHGLSIRYNLNGTKEREVQFKNGLEHGFTKKYTEKGILISQFNYRWGDLIEETLYNEDGTLKSNKRIEVKKEDRDKKRSGRMKF
jgi:antitoxin component YwqK of YwqJK toxin-antitoxin module